MKRQDDETSPSQKARQHPSNDASLTCPVCTTPLQKSYTVLFSVGSIGLAYICRVCLVVYMPDLEPLGRLTGGQD